MIVSNFLSTKKATNGTTIISDRPGQPSLNVIGWEITSAVSRQIRRAHPAIPSRFAFPPSKRYTESVQRRSCLTGDYRSPCGSRSGLKQWRATGFDGRCRPESNSLREPSLHLPIWTRYRALGSSNPHTEILLSRSIEQGESGLSQIH